MSDDKRSMKQRILAQVVCAALAFGWVPALEVTSRYGESDVLDAIDDDDLSRLPPRLRARALHVLAGDPRVEVRSAVANRCGSTKIPLPRPIHQLVSELAVDSSTEVRASLARGLAEAFGRVKPLERTDQLCSWTTSRQPGLRLAAALVLARPLQALGATSCIEQLARDPVAEVRVAAAAAAQFRAPGDPLRCRAVLLELSRDPDPVVASEAWSQLAALRV